MRLIILLLLSLISLNLLFAHSGGTDSKGGHHDKKHGGYHFHHGNPPHQHTNGECPYDYEGKHSNKKSIGRSSSRTDYSGWYVAGAILLSFTGYNAYQGRLNNKIKK